MFSDVFNSYQSLFRSQQVQANTLFSTLTLWHHLSDRKCSLTSDVFHSNETLLSAGLVSAPCSVDLQQYACSSVRRPWRENSVQMSWCWWSSKNLHPSKCAAVSGITIMFPERRCPLTKSSVFVDHRPHCWKPGCTPEVSTIQQQQLLQGDLETAFHQSKWCSGQSPHHLLQHSSKYGK